MGEASGSKKKTIVMVVIGVAVAIGVGALSYLAYSYLTGPDTTPATAKTPKASGS